MIDLSDYLGEPVKALLPILMDWASLRVINDFRVFIFLVDDSPQAPIDFKKNKSDQLMIDIFDNLLRNPSN